MRALLLNVVFEAPEPQALADFYKELLDMQTLRTPPDWMVIGQPDRQPRIAFDRAADGWQPPRWPDPDHPQQLHLDVYVPDRGATEEWLRGTDATRLPDIGGDCHVWADPAGHPFCLCEEPGPPQIANIVFDTEDHKALAAFYAELLGMEKTGPEWEDWITISAGAGPQLGFAKVDRHVRPQWPDPAYPQQVHLDVQFDDQDAAVALAEKLGATRLPAKGGDAPVLADPAGHPFCACPFYIPKMKGWYDEAWAEWLAAQPADDADAVHHEVALRLTRAYAAIGAAKPAGVSPEQLRDQTIALLDRLEEPQLGLLFDGVQLWQYLHLNEIRAQ